MAGKLDEAGRENAARIWSNMTPEEIAAVEAFINDDSLEEMLKPHEGIFPEKEGEQE